MAWTTDYMKLKLLTGVLYEFLAFILLHTAQVSNHYNTKSRLPEGLEPGLKTKHNAEKSIN